VISDFYCQDLTPHLQGRCYSN